MLTQAWNIYDDSFPEDEKRSIELQRNILKKPQYHFKPLCKNEKVIGLLATWDLDNFVFIEHYAIHNQYRGRGYGKEFLQYFLKKVTRKVVLEVEKPETEIAKKRIEFYKRLNFHLNYYPYLQPSYEKNKKPVPLLIMSYPDLINEDEFHLIKNRLYKHVYGRTESA